MSLTPKTAADLQPQPHPHPHAHAHPRLSLFVAGDCAVSRRARANLAAALAAMKIDLPVHLVDVLAAPDEALAERVFVTPALLLQQGGQREMLIGDFSQHDAVRLTLKPLLADAAATTRRSG